MPSGEGAPGDFDPGSEAVIYRVRRSYHERIRRPRHTSNPLASLVLRGKVRAYVEGTTVEVTCKGGKSKGCPPQLRGARSKILTVRDPGWLSVRSALRGSKLRRGAKANFKFTDPGAQEDVLELVGEGYDVIRLLEEQLRASNTIACPASSTCTPPTRAERAR